MRFVDDLQAEDAASGGEIGNIADREHPLRMQARQQAVELPGQRLRHVHQLAAAEIVIDLAEADVDVARLHMLAVEVLGGRPEIALAENADVERAVRRRRRPGRVAGEVEDEGGLQQIFAARLRHRRGAGGGIGESRGGVLGADVYRRRREDEAEERCGSGGPRQTWEEILGCHMVMP
jgi:hypothetical protein